MALYTAMDHRRALMMFLDDISVKKISEIMKCSRQTITSWKKEGLPIEITGGRSWDEFKANEEARAMQLAQARAAERSTESAMEFMESAKDDVKALFEQLKSRLQEGGGNPTFGDVEKLLNVYIRLDNQGADRVLWMQDISRKLFMAVVDVVKDDRMLLKVRDRLMDIQAKETRKLGLIPGKEKLPTPAEALDVSAEQREFVAELDAEEVEFVEIESAPVSLPGKP